MVIPAHAHGIASFTHGSGSSHRSPRTRLVAEELQKAGPATLLMDPLTRAEERLDERTEGSLRFEIGLLAERLETTSEWVRANPPTHRLSVSYFGASTGAAPALVAAAAEWCGKVAAVMSRGGRPDQARRALSVVRAPPW